MLIFNLSICAHPVAVQRVFGIIVVHACIGDGGRLGHVGHGGHASLVHLAVGPISGRLHGGHVAFYVPAGPAAHAGHAGPVTLAKEYDSPCGDHSRQLQVSALHGSRR